MSISIPHDELAALLADGSEEARDRVIAFARAQFDVPYYRSRGDAIRGLAVVGGDAAVRTEVISLLRQGFKTALLRGESGPAERPSLDANFIGVAAAAVALGRLQAKDAEPDLRFALTTVLDAHYELTQTAGPIGVALSALEAGGVEIDAALTHCDRIWKAGNHFVDQLRYARWMAARDPAGAEEWLRTQEKGRPYAVAAIADLDAKELMPSLESRYAALASDEDRRATKVALLRLASQKGPPPTPERMIFGLPLWHENEPADEFPSIYATILDSLELPDAFASPAPTSADRAIMAATVFKAILSGEPARVTPFLTRLKDLSDSRNESGESLVHAAVANHYWEDATRQIALDVIGHCEDVQSENEYGDTPLHIAAARDASLLQALLAKGAKVDVRNRRGETPLFCARMKGLRQCIQLLQAAGAAD